MIAIRNKNYYLLYLTVSVIFISCLSCASKAVFVGSPYDRYDHNRTGKIIITHEGSATTAGRLDDEVYIPYGSGRFPVVKYQGEGNRDDNLPAANLVPIFTGVSLPLSSAPVEGGISDRSDLIDFLAKGPGAHAGVEPGDTQEDTKSAEIIYRPVIDFLSSKEQLTGGREQLIQRLLPLDPDFADEVIDSRYSLSSFYNVLAFRYEKFWFIVYKIPDNDFYSRLVVVPGEVSGQDFSGKKPWR